MMKKLQQEEKKDQQNPERKSENKNEITLFLKSFFAIVDRTDIEAFAKPLISQVSNGYTYNYTYSIFHPPKV